MYTKVNLNKPSGNSSPGAAAPKNEIILIEAEDIAVFPQSDEKGVVMEGNFVLNAGAKMYKIYSTKSKTDAKMETDGDEDSMSFKSTFVAQHPGNKREVKEFVQNWTGKNVIVLHKACGETDYEVMGTPCSPLQLKAAKQDNNDGRHWVLSFEPFAKSGFVPKIYEGAVVFAEPFVVGDVTMLPLLKANGAYYKLPALDASDDITVAPGVNLEHGSVITFIGQGGAAPATLTDGEAGSVTVCLANGTQWTAYEGSVIHLRVFNALSTTYLFELSRG